METIYYYAMLTMKFLFKRNNLTLNELDEKVKNWKSVLLEKRSERIRPGLDGKTLTSWNSLVIQGLTDAYKAFKDKRFLNLALKNAEFIRDLQLQRNGKLFHSWIKGKSTIDGYLEDYALTIQALLSLFETSGDENWLKLARKLNEYVTVNFYDESSGLYYFSETGNTKVLTNYFQKEDNVIPASNSVMANNLHKLYLYLGNPELLIQSKKMLQYITPEFANYPLAYANWGILMLKIAEPYFEVVVCGSESKKIIGEIQSGFQPNILWAFSNEANDVPLLKDRFVKDENLVYVCSDGICKLPVKTPGEALQQLNPGK